ncbi:MAG: hypothetical protein OXE79_03175 [Acidimicrobiaceae bacterium]|nr:hypothetical protein [Acidimicrobiaceae bacterium]MCY4293658.1 hypothetical protein [Acidimicrobiaceae bacterium]
MAGLDGATSTVHILRLNGQRCKSFEYQPQRAVRASAWSWPVIS